MKIGGGFTVVVSTVLVFVAVFCGSVSTWYLLTRGMAWEVGSTLNLCFLRFVPLMVCHKVSSSMHMASISSSLAVVDREVCDVVGCC